jgi:CBS domain-containing protein
MTIGMIMNLPATCSPSDSLETAARIMWDNDCGCVPVSDFAGHLVGMITDRDICMAAYLQGGTLRTMYVGSAMSREAFTCRPENTIAECQEIMRAHQVRRLPVIDGDGQLVGIVSLNDLVRAAATVPPKKNGQVRPGDVEETLRWVSRPRMQSAA